MKRNFICPNCGKVASADESAVGRRARCSKCGEIFTLSAEVSPSASVSSGLNVQNASVSNSKNESNASVPKKESIPTSNVDSLIADFNDG